MDARSAKALSPWGQVADLWSFQLSFQLPPIGPSLRVKHCLAVFLEVLYMKI